MELKDKIKKLSEDFFNDTVDVRRYLHAHPELSFHEKNTSNYIVKRLQEWGIPYKNKVAETGIVAMIEGANPDSKTIALRADMDALPILEENDVPYKSVNKGVMHACGHDVHTSSLLTCGKILNSLKSEFEGTIKLIFQPGEEKIPGGASLMIKEGVLQNPRPTKIFGQHVMPLIPVGKVGFREGIYMASADEIYMTVKGKGGHAAMPDHNVDPILIASHIIVALQQIVSRNSNPRIPSVLSFGKVIADGATNVIPNQVTLEGTFRALDETWRYQAHQKIKKMAESIAEGMGGSCEVDIQVGFPYLHNAEILTRNAKKLAIEYLGEENVVDLDVWMAAEDFAYYSHEIDACFYRLGTRNEDLGITANVHTPTFNIDESALKIGAGLMAWLAIKELHHK